MKKFVQSLLFLLFVLSACKKEADTGVEQFDYFIFGTYKALCTGDCVRYYKIENGKLYKDNMLVGTSVLSFGSNALEESKYSIAVRLLPNFPHYLYSRPNASLGCPDCKNQGGYLLKLKKDGIETTWKIDTDNNSNPKEIQEFITQLKATLNQLP